MSLNTEHILEALESRVLLSADGLLAPAVGDSIQGDHLESQAIVQTIHGENSSDHQIIQTASSAGNSLVEAFGNSEDFTFTLRADSAALSHEKLDAGTAQQESVNEVLSISIAKSGSLPKARFVSCDTLNTVDREASFSMTDEMVETLRAGNGPPQAVANNSLTLCSVSSSIMAEILRFRGAGWVSSHSFSDFASIGLASFVGVLLASGLVQEPDNRKSKTLKSFVWSASRFNKKLSNGRSRKQALSGFRSLGIIYALAANKSSIVPFQRFHKFFITLLAKCSHAFKSHPENNEQRGLRACFKTMRSSAARDFGWRRPVRRSFSEGGGGSTGASPSRHVGMTVKPTKPPVKSTAALRVLAEKAVWLRCSSLTALLQGCAFLASRHTAFSAKTELLIVLNQALKFGSEWLLEKNKGKNYPEAHPIDAPSVLDAYSTI